MKTKIVGTSFRDNRFELPVGAEIITLLDPYGKTTGQKHNDESALSIWYASTDSDSGGQGINYFLGYIPKKLNQNKFTKVTVSKVWYKNDEGVLIGENYEDGLIISGIEIECEGDFQITTEEGRTYETDGKQYQSITSFLGENVPMNVDPLMRWAFSKYKSYDEYKEGLNQYADDGTELHNKIENFLLLKKELDDEPVSDWMSSEIEEAESDAYFKLPKNARRFFDSLGDFEVISVESRVYDDNLGLAGTGDAVLLVKGKRVAFDWKSSKKVNDKHKVQVGFYGKQNDCELGAVVCFGAQNKRGYSVSWVDVENAYKYLTLLKEGSILKKNLTFKK